MSREATVGRGGASARAARWQWELMEGDGAHDVAGLSARLQADGYRWAADAGRLRFWGSVWVRSIETAGQLDGARLWWVLGRRAAAREVLPFGLWEAWADRLGVWARGCRPDRSAAAARWVRRFGDGPAMPLGSGRAVVSVPSLRRGAPGWAVRTDLRELRGDEQTVWTLAEWLEREATS